MDVEALRRDARLAGVREPGDLQLGDRGRASRRRPRRSPACCCPARGSPSCAGARARIPQPTSGDPVKVIMATSGWSTSGSPTARPDPVTTLSQPAGRPHSSSSRPARASADSGVWLAGLSTTGHPAAIAGATLWATRFSGKLNGLMAPTTPIGTRSVKAELAGARRAGLERDDVAGERPGLGGAEAERVDRPAGLDEGGADRLGGLVRDGAGELLGPLVEQDGGPVEHGRPLGRRERLRRRRPRPADGPGRRRRPGRPRPRRTTGPCPPRGRRTATRRRSRRRW